jgi:short subunit dehydrogenase-like uncharacterized protein
MARLHDLVLFGATGFTGGLVADYLATRLSGSVVRWALGGRDRTKLAAVRARLSAVDPALAELPLVVADTDDGASVRAMAESCRVIATTVGPYARWGEPLVAACVDAATDYVDLTGEPAWWKRMIERYHERATMRGALIVPCCGFDSIPHDLGAYVTARELKGAGPIEIDAYVWARGHASGGTWASALGILADPRSAMEGLEPGMRPHFEPAVDRWVVPMPTIDPLVVRRSAEIEPTFGVGFRYRHWLQARSLAQTVGLLAGAGALMGLARIPPARAALARLRGPGEGPTPEQRARGKFIVTFVGRAGSRVVRTEVRGHDPGYDHTSKMIAESALTLVEDRDRLPHSGGVLTPASALHEPLLARLHGTGMEFRVGLA